ncbi:two-component response regulator ORR10-like [Miscanthus floridulus]|uniref:two-component response regulator ORR10-like n=1 Tax=Miscanthus floridulus TaxID=154761 RepID=UPI003458F23D
MSHDDPRSSSTGARAGVDALSLDLLAHALAGVRDPRDRKSYRLASRAFAEMAALAAATGLRELVMDKCLGVTDVGLAKVAVGCPGPEKLSVKWCCEISDIGIELLAKKCPELRSVDISYLKVSNESLRSFSTLEKLEDITMVCCLFTDDDGLQMLSAGNSLKEHYQEQHQQSNNNSNECSNPTNDSNSSNNNNRRKREAEDNEEILPQRNRSRHG